MDVPLLLFVGTVGPHMTCSFMGGTVGGYIKSFTAMLDFSSPSLNEETEQHVMIDDFTVCKTNEIFDAYSVSKFVYIKYYPEKTRHQNWYLIEKN